MNDGMLEKPKYKIGDIVIVELSLDEMNSEKLGYDGDYVQFEIEAAEYVEGTWFYKIKEYDRGYQAWRYEKTILMKITTK